MTHNGKLNVLFIYSFIFIEREWHGHVRSLGTAMASPSCAGEAGDSFESSQCSVDTSGLNATVVAADLIISDRVVAENEAALRQMEVTHIVTIDTHPLMHGNRSAGERQVCHGEENIYYQRRKNTQSLVTEC